MHLHVSPVVRHSTCTYVNDRMLWNSWESTRGSPFFQLHGDIPFVLQESPPRRIKRAFSTRDICASTLLRRRGSDSVLRWMWFGVPIPRCHVALEDLSSCRPLAVWRMRV